MPTRSLPSRNLAIVQPWFSSPMRFSAGTRTSSKKTSLTSKPPSMSSIGRRVTPGESIGKTSIEMPRCFFSAVGSVRQRQKIQSACWPSVVHVFWPLTTQSSPSRTAVVRSEARSEPASGSEKPWHHQMSRFAVLARKRSFCSWLPKAAMTGPIMLALNASGSGTLASCISSRQMWRCSGVQSWPPHSTGQCGTASPAALSTRWVSMYCSLETCRWAATVSRISCGTCVVKKVRISSRKASSSGDSCNRIGPHFLTAAARRRTPSSSTCAPTIPHSLPAGRSGQGSARGQAPARGRSFGGRRPGRGTACASTASSPTFRWPT